MSVLVLIERSVLPGHESSVKDLIREACQRSRRQPACLFSEGWASTLGAGGADEPVRMGRHDRWRTYEDWLAWRSSDSFKEMNDEFRRHQTQPEVIRVYGEYGFMS